MRNRLSLMVAGVVVLALITVWLGATNACGHSGGSSPSLSADIAPHAAVVQVRRAPLSNTLSIAGEFLPYQEVERHAKVAGYIHHINVDISDRVHTGQVLAVLEIPELVAELQAAGAGVRHSEEEISRAQNEVSRAEADHTALHAAATRLKQASEARPGLIAEQELDDATAKDRSAEAQVDAAKSALAASRRKYYIDTENIDGARIPIIIAVDTADRSFEVITRWRQP